MIIHKKEKDRLGNMHVTLQHVGNRFSMIKIENKDVSQIESGVEGFRSFRLYL